MRSLPTALACFAIVTLAGLSVSAQWITCEGPDGTTFRVLEGVISCSEAKTPQDAARGYLEKSLTESGGSSPSELAAALEAEAYRTCSLQPEKNTLGTLYGVGRWGCDNGYTYRETCQGYYLEKEVEAEHGYSVVYYIVVSTLAWNVEVLDNNTVSGTVKRAPAGDVRLSVILGLRTRSAATELAPEGYLDSLRDQYRGQQRAIYTEIVDYCRQYKEAYCQELQSLASLLTRSLPATAGTPPVQLTIVATADKYVSATTSLQLSSDGVRFLTVAGSVVDDRGQPVPNAEIRIPGANVSTRSALDGTYRISTFGSGSPVSLRRVDVSLQRVTLGLSIQTSDAMPILAIAADGVSRLSIAVASRGIRPDAVSVAAPALGDFERASAAASPLTFDRDGNGTLVYIPPLTLSNDVLTDTLTVGSGSASRTISAAAVPIVIRFADPSGAPQTATISIKVCRPPVLLVQSYLGGPAPWAAFAGYAKTRGLDCAVVGEGATWEVGGGSLADWAKDLARNIADVRTTYEKAGVRVGAVEVVAHSAGGLVARSLLEGANPRGDVRRLILVGTPNHGIAWLDQEVAAAAVLWLAAHPAAAANLAEGSAFLRGLVPSSKGRNAEYVNVVGRRTSSLSASRQGSSTVQDDGIISAASSHLDGVPEIRFDGIVHSPNLPLQGTALTESQDVWTRVAELLLGETPSAQPDALRIELRRGKLVSLNSGPQSTAWAATSQFPTALSGSTGVRTGDKGNAAISITQSGELWGSISLDADTEVVLRASSPNLVRIEVVSGRARFRSMGNVAEAGGFEVVLDSATHGSSWYATQPDVRVLGVEADFVVAREEASSVLALAGTVIAEYSKGSGFAPARLVEAGTGTRVRTGGVTEDEALPARGWWTSGVWREPIPFFYFPAWLMALSLLGAALAAVYHVRARRAAEPAARKPSSLVQKP